MSDRPIRILHSVSAMPRAGTETWLMHVLRHADRDRFQMDFLVDGDVPGAYEPEIEALGSRVVRCPGFDNPWQFTRNFLRVLRQHDPYDIVHGHNHYHSGLVLTLARLVGVPVRIAHSHSGTAPVEQLGSPLRRIRRRVLRVLIDRNSTLGLAASRKAAEALFGRDWQRDPRWRILYCGVDLSPFAGQVEARSVRSELGIPADASVIGHVGRFEPPKNHGFLVSVAAEVAARKPNTWLLLVGDGTTRDTITAKVRSLGIANQTVFTGMRHDVPRLMMGAMDVFVFPSLSEGLGLACVEAQAAGLPVLLADSVPAEASVVTRNVRRLPLTESPAAWAQTVIQMLGDAAPRIPPCTALDELSRSPFNIATSTHALQHVYSNSLARATKNPRP